MGGISYGWINPTSLIKPKFTANLNANASRLAWHGCKFECECLMVGLAWIPYIIFAPRFLPAPCIKPLFEDPKSDSLNQRSDSTRPSSNNFLIFIFFFYKKASLINRVQFENSATLIQTPILTKKNVVSPIYAFLSVTKQQIFAF